MCIRDRKIAEGLGKLKWMVVIDVFETEMAGFWKYVDDSSKIKTEVFLLPAALFAEKEGSFTNSGRVIKWKYKAVDPPGEAKDELWIAGQLWMRLKNLYKKEGGKFPDPILNLTWNFQNSYYPTAEEVLREMNGYALADLTDCLLYTSPSPRDRTRSRMPSSA